METPKVTKVAYLNPAFSLCMHYVNSLKQHFISGTGYPQGLGCNSVVEPEVLGSVSRTGNGNNWLTVKELGSTLQSLTAEAGKMAQPATCLPCTQKSMFDIQHPCKKPGLLSSVWWLMPAIPAEGEAGLFTIQGQSKFQAILGDNHVIKKRGGAGIWTC